MQYSHGPRKYSSAGIGRLDNLCCFRPAELNNCLAGELHFDSHPFAGILMKYACARTTPPELSLSLEPACPESRDRKACSLTGLCKAATTHWAN